MIKKALRFIRDLIHSPEDPPKELVGRLANIALAKTALPANGRIDGNVLRRIVFALKGGYGPELSLSSLMGQPVADENYLFFLEALYKTVKRRLTKDGATYLKGEIAALRQRVAEQKGGQKGSL